MKEFLACFCQGDHRVGLKAHGACTPMWHIAKGPGTFLGSCALEIQTIGICYHLIQGERHKGIVRERHGNVLSYKITYKLLRITSTFSERAIEGLCKPNPTPQGEMEHGDTNWNGIWRTDPLPHSSVSLCYPDPILPDNLSTYKYSYN